MSQRSITPAAARVVPFVVFMVFVAASSGVPALLPGAQEWDLRWLYTVRTAAVALLLAALWRHYSELAVAPPDWRGWCLAAAAGVGVFLVWIAVAHAIRGCALAADGRGRTVGADGLCECRWFGDGSYGGPAG